ncbi:MAG: hypothetical protein IKV25_06150 [Clostridia bacterium]|nr:hypothetical protein [Clostridia bacterium]
MKKIVSILVAVLVVFSMFAITASAAGAPTISAVSNVSTAKKDDIVKVTVSTSANSKLCSFGAELIYDATEFEVVTGTTFNAFPGAEYLNTATAGKVKYTGASATNINDATTTLFTVEFKVLKAGGTIKFAVEEAYVTDGTNDIDVTAQIAGKNITIGCAHANKEDKVTTAPTCTAAGVKTTSCKDCGAALGTSAVPAAGHKFADAVVTKAPTCTEAGEKTGTCTVCGEKTTSAVPATGHKFADAVVTKEPTCTEKGEKTGKCTACGTEAKEEIPMAGHKYGDWKVVTPATETKDGVKERTCEVCKKVDTGVISKKPATNKPSGDDNRVEADLGNNTSASMTFAFAAAGLALVTGTVVRRKRK